jgi:hypothetical protein
MNSNLDDAKNLVRYSLFLDGTGQPALGSQVRALAVADLNGIRNKMDGCGTAPDVNDQIITCSAQAELRPLIDLLIANINTLP